jgi:hypothetical protein
MDSAAQIDFTTYVIITMSANVIQHINREKTHVALQMYKMEHAHDPTSRNMGTASF